MLTRTQALYIKRLARMLVKAEVKFYQATMYPPREQKRHRVARRVARRRWNTFINSLKEK